MRFSLLFVLSLLTACQANANLSAKANTSGDVKAEGSADMSTHESSSPPAPQTNEAVRSAPPPQQVTATGSSCPFECFIATGADSIPVTAEEQQRLHSAFVGTMGGMQQCVGGNGWSRRRSSPVLNVRVNFKGEVTDVGVDARGYDTYGSCLENVSRPLPDGTFPGPSTIRCSERCAAPARAGKTRTRAASKAAPASSTQATPASAPAQ
jgi:hypothetical protein